MTEQQNKIIEQLYLSLYVKMLIYAKATLRDEALAEEAVQESFRIACMRPEVLCESPNPSGWLLNTLKNVMRNITKARERANRMLCAVTEAENAMSSDSVRVETAYSNVAHTEEFRLIRGIADGKSMLELARERNISVDACRKRVQRAREYLLKKI
jgi:RNA polymerase sigma-70 factor (ECF subfamily)